MKGRFPFKKLAKYPHLRPEDIKVWEAFIDSHPDFYSSVDYDVKVGEGRDYSSKPDDVFRKDLELLSKKRIDVVGYRNNVIDVIELKPKAGPRALGQAVSYASLYRLTFKPEKNVLPVIITDEEIPDMRSLCLEMNVLYLVCS